jgi:deoxyribodipyrimidine photo-lyase
MSRWLARGLARYDERRDDLAADGTSRLGPYLHLGCVSPLELALRARARPGGAAFARQLAWRDFHHQLLAANPGMTRADFRPRGDRWRRDTRALQAWKDGRTGYPVVDAAMRQLAHEGWMLGRARLLVGSFLTKHLLLDWRLGARHFFELLVDGDVANNVGNWQWVAGTGTDTRPGRMFNPVLQAKRYDPDGTYVRRHVPELAGVDARTIHEPWKLGERRLRELGYPLPIVDHEEAVARFRAARRPG